MSEERVLCATTIIQKFETFRVTPISVQMGKSMTMLGRGFYRPNSVMAKQPSDHVPLTRTQSHLYLRISKIEKCCATVIVGEKKIKGLLNSYSVFATINVTNILLLPKLSWTTVSCKT